MYISKPASSEYAPFYANYLAQAGDTDLLTALRESATAYSRLVENIKDDKGDYRYAPDKWSTKEVLIHINDSERVFAYRALRFARNDKTELSGFDENIWVPESNANQRSLKDILNEHINIRQSSIALFETMTEEMSRRSGIANGKEITVRALGFIICGHSLHHQNTIRERYLK